jgi:hypothetical protein
MAYRFSDVLPTVRHTSPFYEAFLCLQHHYFSRFTEPAVLKALWRDVTVLNLLVEILQRSIIVCLYLTYAIFLVPIVTN